MLDEAGGMVVETAGLTMSPRPTGNRRRAPFGRCRLRPDADSAYQYGFRLGPYDGRPLVIDPRCSSIVAMSAAYTDMGFGIVDGGGQCLHHR